MGLPDALLIRLRLALALYRGRHVTDLHTLIADALNDRGVALIQQGDRRGGMVWLDEALALRPDHAQARNNRGAALTELGEAQAALADLDLALAANPANPNAWSNRGNALVQLGRFAEALACCDRALRLDPAHLDARLNRGPVLEYLRRYDEALASYAAVLVARPDDAGARYNASRVHLAKGDYATGWRMHEARWGLPDLRADWQAFPQPMLRDVAATHGKTVLLWAEQGLGDTLQFCRYASVLGRQTRVILGVPASLARLLRSMADVAAVIAPGDPMPAFDLHCPMMSLPLVFGTRVETIPATVPYLHAPADQVAAWQRRLADLTGLRVGLVWAGNARPHHATARAIDARRSVRLAQLAPLGRVPGVALISLQKYPAGQAAEAPPEGMVLHDWTPELGDFADTAALIAALDLVVTVDTSVAHLAGALGKPVWIMNRFDACWRWLGGRADSPWYPTARLFTQARPGEWAGVVAQVAAALGQEVLQRLHARANTAMQQGDGAVALREIDAILRFTPDSVEAYANRAVAQERLGQTDAALESAARALALDPDHAVTRRNRAALLHRLGRSDAALGDIEHVLARDPDDADALLQRAAIRFALGESGAALEDGRAAAALRPAHVPTLASLSVLLETEDALEAALACCDRALALDPDDLDSVLNRGVVLGRMRRWTEALACYDRVAAARPDDANADYNAGLTLLAMGAYAEGWRRHEARWRTAHLARAARGFAQPQWRGEAIAPGQTILLHAEQGLGDTLQFCRYVPLVAQQADVVLEVPRSLTRLLGRLPGVRAVVAQGDDLPAFDLQCPLMSLPLAFGTTLETIPGPVPYLTVEATAVQAWRRRLRALPGRRVGLVWAGRARAENAALRAIDRRRSMRLAEFAQLGEVPGVSFVSLQKGAGMGDGLVVRDWTEELEDFADTAALVSALDMVITVDTAVAHLAGALGKPVWVLNRFDACWRWLDGRTDSPWYPSARLFWQREAGDWASVVAEVAAALRGMAPRRRTRVGEG